MSGCARTYESHDEGCGLALRLTTWCRTRRTETIEHSASGGSRWPVFWRVSLLARRRGRSPWPAARAVVPGRLSLPDACAAQRGAAQDVVLGDRDVLEAECAHHLEQDHDAGDDRRRAVRVQADDLAALRHGELCEAGK